MGKYFTSFRSPLQTPQAQSVLRCSTSMHLSCIILLASIGHPCLCVSVCVWSCRENVLIVSVAPMQLNDAELILRLSTKKLISSHDIGSVTIPLNSISNGDSGPDLLEITELLTKQGSKNNPGNRWVAMDELCARAPSVIAAAPLSRKKGETGRPDSWFLLGPGAPSNCCWE